MVVPMADLAHLHVYIPDSMIASRTWKGFFRPDSVLEGVIELRDHDLVARGFHPPASDDDAED